MKATIWVLRKVLRYRVKYVIFLAFVFLLSSFVTVGINVVNREIVDSLTNGEVFNSIQMIIISLLVIYVFLNIFSMFMGYLQALGNNIFRLKVDVFIQKLLMKKSTEIRQERFLDSSFSDEYTFVFNNTYKTSSYIFKLFSLIFGNIAIVVSSLVIFVRNEPNLIIFSLLSFLVQTGCTIVTTKLSFRLSKTQIRKERIASYFSDLMTNKSAAKEMRVFRFIEKIIQNWKKNNDSYIKEQIKVEDKNRLVSLIVSIINVLIRLSSILILIFGLKNGGYSIGTFVMLFGLIQTVNSQIGSITGQFFSGFFNEGEYFRDLYMLVYPVSNEYIKESLTSEYPTDVSLPLGKFESLELRDVSFIYPGTIKKAVDRVNLIIRKGEIVSILGLNGSGKTTLSKIICGAYVPSSGNVLINGQNISNYQMEEIFKYFGFAPQDYSKFSLSIKDNVRIGRIEQMNNNKEIEEAYTKAGLESFIQKYEQKDEIILGKEYDESGVDISGGERQKIVIASAYMGNPEVLILDEPTASIDPLSEMKMLQSFRDNLKDKTAILISHRIGFAKLADRILIMKNGKIIESGSHEELLELNGFYAEMFNMQKELYIG